MHTCATMKELSMSDVVAMASFFCDLAPQLGCWLAARQMHIVMLRAVMRAPLTFFDTTPIGRIISRFAKDVDVLDTSLPPQISDTIYCLFEVIFFFCNLCVCREIARSPRGSLLFPPHLSHSPDLIGSVPCLHFPSARHCCAVTVLLASPRP